MKKIKILSLCLILLFAYASLTFSVFAMTGDMSREGQTAGEGIIGDEGAVSTENGNSVGTKETDTSLVEGVTDKVDEMMTDTGKGNTLGDTDGDGAIEGNGDGDMGDSLMPDENISENDNGAVENGDTSELNPNESMADDVTESTAEKTSSWLGILITLIIVVAVVCLIVAFIPKRRD